MRVLARFLLAATLLGAASLSTHQVALAGLAGSAFEIDTDANLAVDGVGGIDWAGLAHATLADPEKRATDLATGANDNSYKGGVKEDTECPGETTGSIPNNKSDLLTFHLYAEQGVGNHPGFLNLGWSRVSDPSGTTLMDFEFNQGELDDPADACAGSPNVKRTAGDLLIEYALTQGGAKATITVRTWTGSLWGNPMSLTDNLAACGNAPCADGTTNTSAIGFAASDGLIDNGTKQARTFGEASIDLRAIFGVGGCASFGSAMLKSRSSDAFTSQVKDFIAPIPIQLQNCGKITIRKETLPDGAAGSFDFTNNIDTSAAAADEVTSFALGDGGSREFANVKFGSYTVTEAAEGNGWSLSNLSCTGGGTTVNLPGGSVSIVIDSSGDDIVCTFTNQRSGAIKITKTRDHYQAAVHPSAHAGVSFTVTQGANVIANLVTDANGNACVDGLTDGVYTVTETVPAGYTVTTANPQNVTVDQAGTCGSNEETVAFHNRPKTDITVSVNSQVDGGTSSSIVCAPPGGTPFVTPASGDGSKSYNDLAPGTYVCTVVIKKEPTP